jgi:hypothetical protein
MFRTSIYALFPTKLIHDDIAGQPKLARYARSPYLAGLAGSLSLKLTVMSSSNTSSSPLIPQFTLSDYTSFFLAGALCCTITHGAMTV